MKTRPSLTDGYSDLAPPPESPLPAMAPRYLGAEGRRIYRAVREEIGHLLSMVDYANLTAYCAAAQQHREAAEHLKDEGAVIENGGKLAKNPWVSVQREAAGTLASLSVKLGIARSARSAVERKIDQRPKAPTAKGGLLRLA